MQIVKKHAFLLMIHKKSEISELFAKLYDDERFVFVIHADKKFRQFNESCFPFNRSKCVYIKRKDLVWGTYSLVDCELRLLEEALKDESISYFHLISGNDFPLKSKEDFIAFFENRDDSFVGFDDLSVLMNNDIVRERCKYYDLFNVITNKHNKGPMAYSFRKLNGLSKRIQRFLKVDRVKGDTILWGSQWFSLNRLDAMYLISKKQVINRTFRFCECPDELFVQTILHSCETTSIHNGNLRLIDWKRGSPYLWRPSDFNYIENNIANSLFIRKIDDIELARMIVSTFDGEKNNG